MAKSPINILLQGNFLLEIALLKFLHYVIKSDDPVLVLFNDKLTELRIVLFVNKVEFHIAE